MSHSKYIIRKDVDLKVCYTVLCVCVIILLQFNIVMLHQGGGFPPDQLAKYRERKQLIDQIVAKDAEEMKRTIDVSILALGYNDLAFILVVQ